MTCLNFWEKSLQGHHYANDKALQNVICEWLQKRDRNSYWRWNYRLLFKDGRMSTKETTLNGNYAFSNTVVKFCGIFKCIICKQHEIKNTCITLWLPLAYATRCKALWFLLRILCLRLWILYFFFVGDGGCGGSWVVELVEAAATMLSNKISLHVSRDQEQLHLQNFVLEHKSYSFWLYKFTVGGTALHPCNYFWMNTFTTYTLVCLHLQIRRRQKYDVQLPAWCNIYLCLHFVMVVFVYQELVLRYMVSTFQSSLPSA